MRMSYDEKTIVHQSNWPSDTWLIERGALGTLTSLPVETILTESPAPGPQTKTVDNCIWRHSNCILDN